MYAQQQARAATAFKPPPPRVRIGPWVRAGALVALLTVGFGGALTWSTIYLKPPEIPEAPVPPAPAAAILSPREAVDHVGEKVRVEFTVREFRFTPGQPQALFLFASTETKGAELRVLVAPEVLAELAERRPLNVNALQGAAVRVSGVVSRDRQFVGIDVTNVDQLEKFPGRR
jgi:hypothetical protein